MATAISDLDFLSADEQAQLKSLLARVAERMPAVVFDLGPNGKPGGQLLMTISTPYETFEWDDPTISEDVKREVKRRLAHPEEFIPVPRLKRLAYGRESGASVDDPGEPNAESDRPRLADQSAP